MKIVHTYPKVGQIEYNVDEAVLAASLYPQILALLAGSEPDQANIFTVFYPLLKAALEEDYILTPKV
ncbi:hypothetical protein M0R72_06795 [Candidatus Pacearchaeota archaeon]|jgi:hypothetical protein|nr:hypothetical protein [Candidatus Pacearchaeota archaeon]